MFVVFFKFIFMVLIYYLYTCTFYHGSYVLGLVLLYLYFISVSHMDSITHNDACICE